MTDEQMFNGLEIYHSQQMDDELYGNILIDYEEGFRYEFTCIKDALDELATLSVKLHILLYSKSKRQFEIDYLFKRRKDIMFQMYDACKNN